MSLTELKLENVRCLPSAGLTLSPRHNLIWGLNGSGKTTVLEAIFLLGRGRSFRTRNSERLIRHGESQLTAFGRTDDSPPHAVGVQVTRSGGTVARINGADALTLADLSRTFPVQVIDPGVHKLVEEGAYRRRRWLDWVVFHVEPRFAAHWGQYTRVVRQRNAALKHQPAQSQAWDGELVRLGSLVASARQAVMEQLQPYWRETVARLGTVEVALGYARGWPAEQELKEALDSNRARDLARGMTLAGPHRADVLVRIANRAAREVLSRGQQKLIAVAMLLAQLRLLRDVAGITPTLLLDDPAAELDARFLAQFIAEVRSLDCQLILTSLTPTSDPFGTPEQVFHVEHGRVGAV